LHRRSQARAAGPGEYVDNPEFDGNFRWSSAACGNLHVGAERPVGNAKLPHELQRNVGRLADLVGLSGADCRVREFAIMIPNERILDDTADFPGPCRALM